MKNRKDRYITLPVKIMGGLTALCTILYTVSLASTDFSDFFNSSISAFFRTVLAYATGWLPFSLAELLIILLIPALAAVIFYAVKISGNTLKRVRLLLSLLSVFAYIFSSFVLTFATAYRGSTLAEKLELDRTSLSADDLIYVTDILTEQLVIYTDSVSFSDSGSSVMPYSFSELNSKLNEAYAKASQKYGFISKLKSKVKSVLLSEPMTYTHISGVYTFFTGEANVNVNYPDFVIPFTMAHEMAHQRGIAREDEANFVAFLVCLESDDSYIRYSAYLNMLEYYFSPLYSANADAYRDMIYSLPESVIGELNSYSDFFDKYRDSVASNISDKVNDTYLQSQGQQDGRQSYGLVVELTHSYYKKLGIQ